MARILVGRLDYCNVMYHFWAGSSYMCTRQELNKASVNRA